LYDGLYADWMRVERETLADGARKRTECLWLSPKTMERLGGGLLAWAEMVERGA
jgi:DNA adenine methylase